MQRENEWEADECGHCVNTFQSSRNMTNSALDADIYSIVSRAENWNPSCCLILFLVLVSSSEAASSVSLYIGKPSRIICRFILEEKQKHNRCVHRQRGSVFLIPCVMLQWKWNLLLFSGLLKNTIPISMTPTWRELLTRVYKVTRQTNCLMTVAHARDVL